MTQEPRFEPVASGRNFELVIQQLRTAIDAGHLKPGQKLPPEQELAAQFAVSRSALREALKVLELSGYLDVRRGYGGGTFVSAPQPDEFVRVTPVAMPPLGDVSASELAQVRLAIEPHTARLAASSLRGRAAFEEAIRHMEIFEDRPARVLAAAVDFHVAVAEVAANPVFVALLKGLRPAMYRSMDAHVRDAEWRARCRQEHERVAKEIDSGDPDRAEEAMRVHLGTEGGVGA